MHTCAYEYYGLVCWDFQGFVSGVDDVVLIITVGIGIVEIVVISIAVIDGIWIVIIMKIGIYAFANIIIVVFFYYLVRV